MVGIQPAMDGPANQGALCIKGQFAFDFVHHPDRLTKPLDQAAPATATWSAKPSWDEALQTAPPKDSSSVAVEKYGRNRSVYGIASGRAPHEAAYTMQKFIRAGFGTNYIDNCSRA